MKMQNFNVAICFIVAVIMILEFFTSITFFATAGAELQNWGVIIAAFALGLAAINLVRIHARRVMLKRGEWWNSAALLFFLFYQIIVGISLTANHPAYDYTFQNIMSPLGATMYAMLAFWIASAAYRAFIARSIEAGILLVSASITMLGNAPIGESIWAQFPALGGWILDVPNTAAMRGIMIGAAIGAIALGVRVLLGIERGHLGGTE